VSLSVGAEPTCGRGVIAEGDLLPANGCGCSSTLDVCELAAVNLDPVPVDSRLVPTVATIVTAIGM
jgi:hypothetical protein